MGHTCLEVSHLGSALGGCRIQPGHTRQSTAKHSCLSAAPQRGKSKRENSIISGNLIVILSQRFFYAGYFGKQGDL